MQNEYIDEMMLALEANIEYLKKKGSNRLFLKNGALIDQAAQAFIYEFELDFFQNIEEDAEIEIRVGYQSANGKIISLKDKTIRVEIDSNLGKKIPEAQLIISSYYLLELLKEKLSKINKGEEKQTDLVYKTFAVTDSKTSYSDEVIPTIDKIELDKYKKKALQLTLGSEVSYIWGPPGTGKTQLIARMIEAFLHNKFSVLLLSHTNVATDGALERTLKLLQSSDYYQDGKMLRIGNVKSISSGLVEKYPLVLIENIIEMKIKPLREEIIRLTEEIYQYNSALTDAKESLEQMAEYTDLIESIERNENKIDDFQTRIKEKQNKQNQNKTKLTEIAQKINKYQSSNMVSRLFLGYSLDILTYEKATILSSHDKLVRQIEILKGEIEDLKHRVELEKPAKVKLEKILDGKSYEMSKYAVEAHSNKIKNLNKQIKAFQKQIDDMSSNLIKEAKVVGTTLTKSYSSKEIISREYDCVIVDEASMAPLPALWCAAGLAKEKVVIVGDFFQLPPIAQHDVIRNKEKTEEEYRRETELVEKWLKNDIFSITQIQQSIKNQKVPGWLAQLKMQYRMHPDIAGIINELVYAKYSSEYALESDRNTHTKGKDLLNKEPLKNAHVGIYDTSQIGAIPSTTDSGSYYNLYHALIVVQLAETALQNGYKDIGIISPFRAQINLIQEILKDKNLSKKIAADTVHRFQGGEEQLIIFDLVTYKKTKLTDDGEDEGDDEKLLNVAFSRAQEKCILIADLNKTLNAHSSTSQIKKFVEYCQNNKFPIIQTESLYHKYEATDESEEWLKKIGNVEKAEEEIKNAKLFDETDFYPQFIKDLLNAESEIIIDSPYITENRVKQLLPYFQHLRNKDVNIFILTRIPKEHDSLMRYQAEQILKIFESLGIIVLPFYGYMHRKIAIIDRKILWEGSLNILSQRTSQEIMRRFEGESTSEQMIKFLNLEKNIGKKIGQNNLQHCEYCSEIGSWYWTDKSRFGGYWTYCLTNGHALGKPPKSPEEKRIHKERKKKLRNTEKKKTENGTPICPAHEVPMIIKKGRWGEFWGCPQYPRCEVTEKYNK